jgi:phage shock protein A
MNEDERDDRIEMTRQALEAARVPMLELRRRRREVMEEVEAIDARLRELGDPEVGEIVRTV